MADATLGSRSTQASANWARLRPASAASGFSRSTASSTGRCSSRSMKPPISPLVARLSAGGGRSGLYLPVSTPWASGDQTICEIPLAAQSGITAFSGCRQSREYCGWLETDFSTPGISTASRIFSAGHSEKPI